jgi:importin subunit beta-1
MAQVVDITALLQAAQSADAAARQQAEAGIKQLESQPESYLLSLSSHLANEANGVDTRRLAGRQKTTRQLDHLGSCSNCTWH